MTFAESACESLRESHYQNYYYKGLESQFQPVQDDDLLHIYGDPAHPPYKFRIPNERKTGLVDNDRPMDFAWELIDIWGTSWWDYVRCLTIGCNFDVDFGHGRRGKTAEEITDWDRRAATLPYLMNSRSKGGHGRHGNVFLEKPLPAASRAEHKRNCRAITACVSAALGIDLFDYVCQWGLIQYIYAREPAKNGLTLVTPATEKLILPDNWLELTTPFERATKAQNQLLTSEAIVHNIELDDIHRSIGDTCRRHGYAWSEERHNDRTIISLHLGGLKIDHEVNKRLGAYDTNSPCSHKSNPNGFAFLKPNGGLALRWFGGAADVPPWYQGPSGIWCCDYNIAPTFGAASEAAGGAKKKKEFVFYDGKATNALAMLGAAVEIPDKLRTCRTDLERRGNNTIVISIHSKDIGAFDGWTFDYTKYVKQVEYEPLPEETDMFEARLRHTSDNNKGLDWMTLDDRGHWKINTYSEAKEWIKGHGYSAELTSEVIKYHMERNWLLEKVPFGSEYSGDRMWNRDGARFAVTPRPGDFKHSKMILEHVGAGLTPYLDEWCGIQGIKTGGDYLMWWAARMFRYPKSRLPYLFLFSPEQNSGKSSFHRMLLRLFANSNGWCELRKELIKDDFNDLLCGCALAYLEEIDLSISPVAYDLVKNLVDGTALKMRGIYAAGKMETNYVHFIHPANHLHYCPIQPGDKRTVIIRVRPYEGEDMPWEDELRPLIDSERSAFLHALLNLKMPKTGLTRLYLPVLTTPEKTEAMAIRESEGWYGQLKMFAADEQIKSLEATEILRKLGAEITDSRLPKSASGLGAKLKSLKKTLAKDGFNITWDDKTPASYTIIKS